MSRCHLLASLRSKNASAGTRTSRSGLSREYSATTPIVIASGLSSMTASSVPVTGSPLTGGRAERMSAFITINTLGPGASITTMPLAWKRNPPSTVPITAPMPKAQWWALGFQPRMFLPPSASPPTPRNQSSAVFGGS